MFDPYAAPNHEQRGGVNSWREKTLTVRVAAHEKEQMDAGKRVTGSRLQSERKDAASMAGHVKRLRRSWRKQWRPRVTPRYLSPRTSQLENSWGNTKT